MDSPIPDFSAMRAYNREGIVMLFDDKDWALEEYDRLVGEIEDTLEKSRLESSRRQHLESHCY